MCCVKRFRLGHEPETFTIRADIFVLQLCIPIAIMHLLLFFIYRPMVLVLKISVRF